MDIKQFGLSASLIEAVKKCMSKEELVGNQKKLDANKNGKLDAQDFKKLRGEGKYADEDKDEEEDEDEKEEEEDDEEEEVEISKAQAEKMIAAMKKAKGFDTHIKTLQSAEEGYVSHAQRKAVWASRNDEKEAMKRKMKKEDVQLEEGATGAKPGWMLKQDPALAKKVKDSKRGHEALKKWAGKLVPKDNKSVDEAIETPAYAIMHKLSKKILSTHKDLASAKDEWTGIDKEQRPFYKVVATNKSAKNFSMKESLGMYGDQEVSWEKGGRRAPTGAFRNPANKSVDDSAVKAQQSKMNDVKNKMAKSAKEEVKLNESNLAAGRKPEKDDHEPHPTHGYLGLTKGDVRDTAYKEGERHAAGNKHGSNAKTWGAEAKHYSAGFMAGRNDSDRSHKKMSKITRTEEVKPGVKTDYELVKSQTKNTAPTKKLVVDYSRILKKPVKEEVELKEGTFKYHMTKAIAAKERGDEKKKAYHLDNARTAKFAMKTADYAKNRELLDKHKQMTEEVQIAEAAMHRVNVTVSDPNHTMVTQRKEKIQKIVRVKALDKENALHKANQYYKDRGYRVHGAEHIGMINEEAQLDEAGPFSYGAKPPRKGSVAYNAMMKRKEQEKGKPPIEPKDQMVGVAKVVKEAFPTVADVIKKDKEKSKFDTKKISTGTVYTKKYKDKEKEEKDAKGIMDEAYESTDAPFDGPYAKKKIAVPGKQGIGPSAAKHLAKMAMAKQIKKKSNK